MISIRNYMCGDGLHLLRSFIDLREIISGTSLDYFLVSVTKLDSCFPSAQFHINENEVRTRTIL